MYFKSAGYTLIYLYDANGNHTGTLTIANVTLVPPPANTMNVDKIETNEGVVYSYK